MKTASPSPLRRRLILAALAMPFSGGALAREFLPKVDRYLGVQRFPLTAANGQAQAIPETLLLSPGSYEFDGAAYDCTAPGFYRFWSPMKASVVRAVPGTVRDTASAAAWWSMHGLRDLQKPGEAMPEFLARVDDVARSGKVAMTCGNLHTWAVASIFKPAGIETRTVRYLTMGTSPEDLNGYDEGHICLEAKWNGRWVLIDLTGKRMFKQAGTYLNASDAVPAIASGSWEDDILAPAAYEPNVVVPGKFDMSAWMEANFLNVKDQRAWYQRLFQAVGIDAPDGRTYWKVPPGKADRADWIKSLSTVWDVLPDDDWNQRFYS